MFSTVFEVDSGPRHEIGDCSRNQSLAWFSCAAYPGRRVHGNARNVFTTLLDFADVNSSADGDVYLSNPIGDCLGAEDGRRRTVECCKHTVTGRLHKPAAEPGDLTFREEVVAVEPIPPHLVSEAANRLGGLNDVGE